MHRNRFFLCVVGVLMIMPVAVFAQTTDQQALIRQLTQRAAQLQLQIDQLRKATNQRSPSDSGMQGLDFLKLPQGLASQGHASSLPFAGGASANRQSPVASGHSDEGPEATVSFDRDLYFGLRNDADVSNLQEFLTDKGFYDNTISGNFFILTRNAVKKFQAAHGVRPTGYFGHKSRIVANALLQGTTVITPANNIDIDAAKEGRNIARLKKGHNVVDDGPAHNYRLYQDEIGYAGALARVHDGTKFALDDKKGITSHIEKLLKAGKPDLMVNILGMPKNLASAFQDQDKDRSGCMRAWATTPPNDYNKWKEYVKGWVAALKPYGIAYWEIWNEPGDALNPGCFWSGTEAEFFKLYQTTVEAIREAYDGAVPIGVKIGGPAVAGFGDKRYDTIFGSSEPLYKTLPRFAGAQSLPLDFFSWHFYDSGDTRRIVDSIPATKSELTKNGFSSSELIIDEYDLSYKNYFDAIAIAADFMAMAKNGLDRQSMFQFNDLMWMPDGVPLNVFKYTGLFGLADQVIVKPRYNVFKAINLMGDTMIGVASQPTSIADNVLALKSSEQVGVMALNPTAAPSPITLTIKNVPSQFTAYEKYIIDATHSNSYQFEPDITQKVKQTKIDAAAKAEQPFKAYLAGLSYTQSQIDYFWSQGRLVLIALVGDHSADQVGTNITAYCKSQGLNPTQCAQDIGDAYIKTSAKTNFETVYQSGIDAVNAMKGVALDKVESRTIPRSGSATGWTHIETLTLEPYSVVMIRLSGDVPPPPTHAPAISQITPPSGAIGSKITLVGVDFTPAENTINFGRVVNAVINLPSLDGTMLSFVIPPQLCNQLSGIALCPLLMPNTYTVSVTNANGTSNAMKFTVVEQPPSKGSLTIDPVSATLKVGENIPVKAIFAEPRPACLDDKLHPCRVPERAPYEVEASFTSSDPSVATVDAVIRECASPPPGITNLCSPYYFVRGIAIGSATITASYANSEGTFTAKMNVTVVASAPPPQQRGSLSIVPVSANLAIGEQVPLQAYYQPPLPACLKSNPPCELGMMEPAPTPVIASFTSDNPNVAAIDQVTKDCTPPRMCPMAIRHSVVRGVSAGSATITASLYTDAAGTFTATMKVMVGGNASRARGSLSLDPPSAMLAVGETVKVKAIFTPPRPACLDAFPACKVAERLPYEVDVALVSSDKSIALTTCPPESGRLTCIGSNGVRGVAPGKVTVTGTYTNLSDTFVATMTAVVTATPTTP